MLGYILGNKFTLVNIVVILFRHTTLATWLYMKVRRFLALKMLSYTCEAEGFTKIMSPHPSFSVG